MSEEPKEKVDAPEKSIDELIREKFMKDRQSAIEEINQILSKYSVKLEVRHQIEIVPTNK